MSKLIGYIDDSDGKIYFEALDASDVDVDASGFSGNLSGSDTDVQTAFETLDALTLASSGSDISLSTTNFDGLLSATEDTVQKAFDVLDDVEAEDIPTDTTNFDGNLSGSDTTVQAALETLDEIVAGIGLPNGIQDYETLYWTGSAWARNSYVKASPSCLWVGGISSSLYNFVVQATNANGLASIRNNGGNVNTRTLYVYGTTGHALDATAPNIAVKATGSPPFYGVVKDASLLGYMLYIDNFHDADAEFIIDNNSRIRNKAGIEIDADSFTEIPIILRTLTGGGNTLLIFGDGSVNTLEIDDDGSIIQRKYNETDNFLEFIRPGSWATPDRSVYLVDPSGRVISQNSVSVQPLDGIESGSPAFEVMFPELFTSNFAEYKRGGIDYFIVDYLGNLLSKGDVASEQSVIATKSFVLGGTKGFSKEVRFYNEFDNDTGSVADAEIFLDGENGSRFQIPENSTGKGRIEFSYLNLNSDNYGWLTAEFRIRWYNTGVGLTLTATLVDMDENGGSTMTAPAISTYTDGDDDYIQIEQTVPNGYNEQMYAWGQFNITQIIS